MDMASLTIDTESVHCPHDHYTTLGLMNIESGTRGGGSEFPQVLSLLSSLLERTIHKNESWLLDSTATREVAAVTMFHGLRAPDLSIQSYTERIFKYSKCSPSCFILAQIYIDKYLQQLGARLTNLNVHRLLMTSVVIAAKFIDDG